MAGRGGVLVNNATGELTWSGFVPNQCQPNTSILRFTANFTWEEAREPLHADIDVNKTNGIGPGMPFAHELLAEDPSSYGIVGLVPCAIGGTKIDEWAKGTQLYNEMVRRAQANTYQPKLQQLFMDVRFDLMSPTLPIIQVAIVTGEGSFIDAIRKAQLGIDLPNVQTVDPKSFAVIQADKLHLTPESQVQLGTLMADTFIKLDAQPPPISKCKKSAATPASSAPAFHLALIVPLLTSLLLIILTNSSFRS
ncbi:hypothetical protein FNV43_RR11787 [Rhamnella rubrinervis]|uniref:Sialate O-acetylesterase domain-containing protein n=1 Tax=Rhamnella rubrinervis TaxID=2594499 RepID=A0A8K0H6B5_9ROSA|nr:hypothetical protein FNV43_RR11787 [Rhamnella rubrinervis]